MKIDGFLVLQKIKNFSKNDKFLILSPKKIDKKNCIENLKNKDTNTISRLITAVENYPELHKETITKIKDIASKSKTPVLGITGTGGAGKSSLVTAFQRWSRFLETDAIAVNLDPGAERVHYDAEFDVRDLISLTEVMTEYDLGPNGAQILAADLLAAQAGDVAEQLHALSGELMIVDTPGQVELFAFREASNHLIEVLGRNQSAIIYLFDPMLSRSPSGFVSQMLLSSIVEFRLGLPTKNFLSKSDLLEPEELEKILEWSERLEILEMALYDEAGGQRTEFAINQLRMMQEFAQAPGLTPLSSELEEGLADVLTFAPVSYTHLTLPTKA